MSEGTVPWSASRKVADAADVSTATVSTDLSGNGHVSETTKARVTSAAALLGYVVSSNASSLATGRTLYNEGGGGEKWRSVFEHFLLRQRVDAVVAISRELTTVQLAGLLALGKPIVGVGGPPMGVHTFSVDDGAVVRLTDRYFAAASLS